MSDIPVQVIVAAYPDETSATNALKELQAAKKQGLIEIRDAAVLTKDAQGKLHINDTKDWGFGKGAAVGGAVGIVAGILAGPIGWGLLGGALIGGVAAKMADGGFDNKRLEQVGASLKPGSSAIVAIIDHVWVAQAEAIMRKEAMDTTVQSISADIAKELDENHQVVYSAIATSGAVQVDRAATGKDSADVTRMVATSEGMVAANVNVQGEDVKATMLAADKEGDVAVATATGKLVKEGEAAPQVEAPKAEDAPAAPAEGEKPAAA